MLANFPRFILNKNELLKYIVQLSEDFHVVSDSQNFHSVFNLDLLIIRLTVVFVEEKVFLWNKINIARNYVQFISLLLFEIFFI